MVLEDVTEVYVAAVVACEPPPLTACWPNSREFTPEGAKEIHLDQILLNGNNIALLVPGGDGPTG